MSDWKTASDWESSWWGNCTNTIGEEIKQRTYIKKMGLNIANLQDKTILDIGGGPVSILLKLNFKKGYVFDPCNYPNWVSERYKENNIDYQKIKGEDIKDIKVDEVWIYNVLQHTDNPQKIIENALKASKVIRIFEWVEEPISDGHIHTLHKDELDKWLGGEGKTEQLNENGCIGLSYYGIFKGDNYV
jgi:hypothetical protein